MRRFASTLAWVVLAVGCAADGGTEGLALDDGCAPATERTRLARLTHRQYDRTVQDLLFLPSTFRPSETFLGDPRFAGFDNNADELAVSGRLALDYRRAAEEIADRVLESSAYDRLVPCEDASGCATALVNDLGRRAYRRPLTSDEVGRLLDLFGEGFDDPSATSPFRSGVHLVIQGVLQSPKFLYRVELGNTPDLDRGLVPLDDWEVATRLSYMLWNTMPDDVLFAAARAGELGTAAQVRAQAVRMLDDPRARDVVADFHGQWLGADRWTSFVRDPARYPENVSGVGAAMREENRRFVAHVVFDQVGGLRELLTSSTTFVDDRLAPIYGLTVAEGSGFDRVELDPDERAGLLTQAGFLAQHAYYDEPSPIHRGVFVQRKVLCATIPDPPSEANLDLPPIGAELPTNRARVEAHTSPDECARCHGFINPAGFAFEGFDAIGRSREEDSGYPVDTAVSLPFAVDDVLEVDGAVALAHALADREEPYRCYATQWLRYAYGREDADGDRCLIDRLAGRLYEDGVPVKELVADLASTAAVRFRPPTDEEGP